MRAAMNAIFYLLRTGCPWRYLPRDSFPPRSTVYTIFRKFQRDGVWEAIWAELHMALRERMGREASPSVQFWLLAKLYRPCHGWQRCRPRDYLGLPSFVTLLPMLSSPHNENGFPGLGRWTPEREDRR